MRRISVTLLAGVAGVGVIWLGGQIGWWWVTSLVGLAIGLALRPARLGITIALLVGGLGWGLPLALLALSVPVGAVASAVESVIGLSASGGLAIILATILLGCVLCLVGAWVGIAGRQLLPAWQKG